MTTKKEYRSRQHSDDVKDRVRSGYSKSNAILALPSLILTASLLLKFRWRRTSGLGEKKVMLYVAKLCLIRPQ